MLLTSPAFIQSIPSYLDTFIPTMDIKTCCNPGATTKLPMTKQDTFLVLFVTLPPPGCPALAAALLCEGCKHLFAQVTKQYRAQREREQTLIDRAEH